MVRPPKITEEATFELMPEGVENWYIDGEGIMIHHSDGHSEFEITKATKRNNEGESLGEFDIDTASSLAENRDNDIYIDGASRNYDEAWTQIEDEAAEYEIDGRE